MNCFNIRLLLIPILMLAALTLAGCGVPVNFPAHAPYTGRNKIDSPLVVVLPDHYTKVSKTYKVKTALFTNTKYEIHYGQALAEEAMARFRNKFETVEVFSDIEFATLTDTEPRGHRFQLKEDEKPEDIIYTDEQIAELEEELIFAPTYASEDTGWLLRIYNVNFRYEFGLAQYRMEVEFMNRETGEMLVEGTLRGRGTPQSDRSDSYTNQKLILESVTTAFANGFSSLERNLDEKRGL